MKKVKLFPPETGNLAPYVPILLSCACAAFSQDSF